MQVLVYCSKHFCAEKMHAVTLILLLTLVPLVYSNKYENIPDYALKLEERIEKHGYPVEIHQIITEDGYILGAYRIPHGVKKEEPENRNKSAVLIVHGMGGAPHNFLVLGKERAAPYYFADRGIDVWLFAARASETPFKKHIELDWDKDPEFWAHSFHEIGIYDVAATIDYILNCTGQEKVTLIGHSAGGTEFYVLLADRPEYNQKVKVTIGWGAAPILHRMDYPVMLLGIYLDDFIKFLFSLFARHEVLPGFIADTKSSMIDYYLQRHPLWYNVLKFSLAGIGSHNSILARYDEYNPIIISNIPRMSGRQLLHFLDNVKTGTFKKYDYGPKGNLKRYGQKEPPHYNISAITAPAAFFNSGLDGEISLADVCESIRRLPNPMFLHRIPFHRFTHTDYIFGYNATELVYEPTLQLIRKIDNGVVFPRVKVPSDY
ncbi:unnamed protein product [Ceutorhynchus assimilis]|uniref:Lipase n=1 Tax=Ceutorhynchus assimilis TaxID=467358 RepID=A0A9N9MQQ2_9CUCU|nr:unnamed protein product [Ceutorhynchus assimilis]